MERREYVLRGRLIAMVERALAAKVPPPNLSECAAHCYTLPKGTARQQCLEDCEAEAAVKAVADYLNRELWVSFMDYIWGGGDIDPVPLEAGVRARFAEGRNRRGVPE